jgi:hypothetical protein
MQFLVKRMREASKKRMQTTLISVQMKKKGQEMIDSKKKETISPRKM